MYDTYLYTCIYTGLCRVADGARMGPEIPTVTAAFGICAGIRQHRPVNTRRCNHKRIDMCMDMYMDMCMGRGERTCVSTCVPAPRRRGECERMDMCTDICMDMCTDMCMDMCVGMHTEICIDMWERNACLC